ncbi:hypothetical protein DSO57_1036107 [Entomophthora muscae]|uniref:Uncharacterized protein n=1 Tax=Entomophthora muscae TaxID=34485 RepID=A0ACC2TXT9_9FUNG|nr:hypothetical protein DSO57_1036107 [Entomophthora muscae]
MANIRPPTRSLTIKERYINVAKIGEGAYGVVFKATDVLSNTVVAIKKMGGLNSKEGGEEGISATTLREVSLLKELKHTNIISLVRTHYERSNLYLIFDFIEIDLKKFLESAKKKNAPFRLNGLKIMHDLLSATEFLHTHGIVHRDIKPQNILVNKEHQVKLADFGLARFYSVPAVTMTHEVVTLWYRAPEILLGVKRYTAGIDIWSLGCIFVELVNLRPLFCGDSEIDQLFRIFQIQGTPTPATCPSLCGLKQFNVKMPVWKKADFTQVCPKMKSKEVDLVKSMLDLEPHKRISAKRALKHSIFSMFPTKSELDSSPGKRHKKL